jgi:3-phenylpropionate/trans-cinnamate dioxygenase ferredoxin subunit
MSNWVKVASAADVADGAVKGVEISGKNVALYNISGKFHATDDVCSHAYALLSDGYLDVDNCAIECPFHSGRFDILTGKGIEAPATVPIKVYAIRQDGGDLLVDLD